MTSMLHIRSLIGCILFSFSIIFLILLVILPLDSLKCFFFLIPKYLRIIQIFFVIDFWYNSIVVTEHTINLSGHITLPTKLSTLINSPSVLEKNVYFATVELDWSININQFRVL